MNFFPFSFHTSRLLVIIAKFFFLVVAISISLPLTSLPSPSTIHCPHLLQVVITSTTLLPSLFSHTKMKKCMSRFHCSITSPPMLIDRTSSSNTATPPPLSYVATIFHSITSTPFASHTLFISIIAQSHHHGHHCKCICYNKHRHQQTQLVFLELIG